MTGSKGHYCRYWISSACSVHTNMHAHRHISNRHPHMPIEIEYLSMEQPAFELLDSLGPFIRSMAPITLRKMMPQISLDVSS